MGNVDLVTQKNLQKKQENLMNILILFTGAEIMVEHSRKLKMDMSMTIGQLHHTMLGCH